MRPTFVTSAYVLLLAGSNSYAETVTATGTIEVIDSKARSIKVLRKTAKGEKSGTFSISPTAEVLVDGKATDLGSLAMGQTVVVTYDTKAKLVIKIEMVDSSPKPQVLDLTGMVRTFTGQKSAPGTLAFSPDGRRAASGGDKIVWCWDVSNGSQKWSYTELAPVLNVRFSPDGKRIVACTKNRCVIYDADSANDLAAFDIGQPLQAATISHDCRLLGVIYEEDHKAAVYSIERRRVIHKIAAVSFGPTIAFSRNNAKLVFGYAELHQFDLKTGKLKPNHIVQPTGSVIAGADFSPDNEFLATGSHQQYFPELKKNGLGDRMVRLWNVGNGQLVREFRGHREFIPDYSPGSAAKPLDFLICPVKSSVFKGATDDEWSHPMGEAQKWMFEPSFNRAIKVRGGDDRLTSDAGVLLQREADHRLGLTESLASRMYDPRNPEKIRYTVVELLRERVYAFGQGYSTQDDLDRLAHDPALKMAVWDQRGDTVIDERLASQPTQCRLIDTLASFKSNLEELRGALSDWMARHLRAAGGDHAARRVTLDIDSFPLVVHGQQAGAKYNGYYCETIFHPLLASFSVNGDYDAFQYGGRLGNGFVHAMLRAGNVHTAQGALRFIRTAVNRATLLGYLIDVRLDAGFTSGKIMDGLTDDGQRFIGRLKANPVLDRLAEPHLTRLVGRPPAEGYESLVELGLYRAEGWRHAQRLILVVIDKPDAKTGQLNLMPDYFFLITNQTEDDLPAEAGLEHYRKRGTFEDRLGEFNAAVLPRLSSPGFVENEATLLLALLGFNLTSMLRCELEDDAGACLDLRRFQRQVLQAGARVTKHSGRLCVDLAKAVSGSWERLIKRIAGWRLPSRWPAPVGAILRTWIAPPPHAFVEEVLQL